MHPPPYFATGVYVAIQSFAFRGAALKGGGGGGGSGLRVGGAAGRVHHHFFLGSTGGSESGVISRRHSSSSSSSMGVSDGIRSRKRARSGSLPTHILHGFAGDSGSIGPDRRRFRSRSSGRIETALEGQHGSKSGGGGGGSRRQRAAAAAASAAAVQGGAKSPAAAGPTRKQSTNTRSANRRQNSGMDPRLPTFGIDIPESRIYMVDTTERVEAAGAILARSVVMSIDTETQPSFTAGEWHPTSLLQIATRDVNGEEDVLVIDLLSLKSGLRLPKTLSATLLGPFTSPEVIKLGVGLAEDLNDMCFAFGEAPFLREVPGVLNLNELHALLVEQSDDDEANRDELGRIRAMGLQKFATMYLGRSLSKKQQTSRWARRPLQDAQINYAACDALVALRVFDALGRLLESSGQGLDLQKVTSTWTPRKFTEQGLVKEKVVRLRRKLKARDISAKKEHIRYEQDRS